MLSTLKKMEKSSVIEFASGHGLRWEEEEEDNSRWGGQSRYFWRVDIGLEPEWEEGVGSVWGNCGNSTGDRGHSN